MSASLLADAFLRANHWNVVIGVGLAFFLAQVVLAGRLYLRARRQARVVTRLNRDYDRGGDGRGKPRSIPKDFTWLRWVLTTFPAGSQPPVGNFTRDDVLAELDTRIAADADYLLLQRLGVMAPLLGVILTVVGFFWLDVKTTDDQSLQGILLSVTPLVIGVGAGAALALVNQALLFSVGGRVEALRLAARTWFDTVVWNHAGLDSQAATAKAIAAVDRFTRVLVDAADRHSASTSRVEQSAAALQVAATRFGQVVDSFHTDFEGVPQTLRDVQTATAAAAQALQELIPVGTRAVSNLDVSVAAFRSTIDREFAAVTKLQERSSKLLAQSAAQVHDSTALLRTGSAELQRAAQSNAAAYQGIDASVRQHLAPGIQQFFDAAHAVTGQVAQWNSLVGTLSHQVEAVSSELHRACNELLPSVAAACGAAERQSEQAAATHRKQIEASRRSTDEFRESVRRAEINTSALSDLLRETLVGLQRAVASINDVTVAGPDIEQLTDALNRLAESADTLGALPELIREALETRDGDGAVRAKARGGLRAWLPGRPR